MREEINFRHYATHNIFSLSNLRLLYLELNILKR